MIVSFFPHPCFFKNHLLKNQFCIIYVKVLMFIFKKMLVQTDLVWALQVITWHSDSCFPEFPLLPLGCDQSHPMLRAGRRGFQAELVSWCAQDGSWGPSPALLASTGWRPGKLSSGAPPALTRMCAYVFSFSFRDSLEPFLVHRRNIWECEIILVSKKAWINPCLTHFKK